MLRQLNKCNLRCQRSIMSGAHGMNVLFDNDLQSENDCFLAYPNGKFACLSSATKCCIIQRPRVQGEVDFCTVIMAFFWKFFFFFFDVFTSNFRHVTRCQHVDRSLTAEQTY